MRTIRYPLFVVALSTLSQFTRADQTAATEAQKTKVQDQMKQSVEKRILYQISPEIWREDGYFEKMALGEPIGKDTLVETKVVDLEAKAATIPQEPGELIKWGRPLATEKGEQLTKLRERFATDFEAKKKSRETPEASPTVAQSSQSYRAFRTCALAALPKLKHALGARIGNDVAATARYILRLVAISGQTYAELRGGALPCGNHLRALNFSMRGNSDVERMTEAALALSTLIRFKDLNDPTALGAVQALWLNFHPKAPHEKAPFWKQYWAYLNVDILLRRSPRPLNVIEYLRSEKKSDLEAAATADQKSFESFLKEAQT